MGPTAIALCTDYLFKSPAAVDSSMALVAAIVCPLATVMFLLGQKPYSTAVLAQVGHQPLDTIRNDPPPLHGNLLGPSQSHH